MSSKESNPFAQVKRSISDKFELSVPRVGVMGARGTGKSSFVEVINTGKFEENTIVDSGTRRVKITYKNEEHSLKMDMIDYGDIDIKNLEWARDINVFVCIYSISDKGSFDFVREMIEAIRKEREVKGHMILVGNKSDLNERMVEENMAQEYAGQNSLQFIEVSCKNKLKIDPLFRLICTLARESRTIITNESFEQSFLSSFMKSLHSTLNKIFEYYNESIEMKEDWTFKFYHNPYPVNHHLTNISKIIYWKEYIYVSDDTSVSLWTTLLPPFKKKIEISKPTDIQIFEKKLYFYSGNTLYCWDKELKEHKEFKVDDQSNISCIHLKKKI